MSDFVWWFGAVSLLVHALPAAFFTAWWLIDRAMSHSNFRKAFVLFWVEYLKKGGKP